MSSGQRPHGSNAASRDWSIGQHEPYWRTNTSFSPPPSRWDFQFHSEVLPYGLNDGNQLYASSASSNSKGSAGWVRGNRLYDMSYSATNGPGVYLSSPSDLSQGPQWAPPALQEITVDDYEMATGRDPASEQVIIASMKEGTSENVDSQGSNSSHSDSSESEPIVKSCLSAQRNSSRRSFISKPIHPLCFPSETPTREAIDSAIVSLLECNASTPFRDVQCRSSAGGNIDFADVSDSFETDIFGRGGASSDGFKCNLCERFLSQRSPWSSRRIVRSGDMPTIGVLSCCHVFHAECLEQTTPKTFNSDPPCPLCVKSEESSPDQYGIMRLRGGFPRLKPFSEEGPSRPWRCAQVGDCVEGALHTPSRNALVLLNRDRMKKNLSLKGNLSKEFPGKLKKSMSYSSHPFTGREVDKRTPAEPSMSR